MVKKKYNKTTPLREEDDDLNIDDDLETGTDTKTTDTDDIFDDSATFLADKTLGIGASAIQPKAVDTSATDEYLAEIEKPASASVYDKMAARYRSQGEGAVLRTQKNLANLFAPTITLIKEREAAASARFTLLKEKMPEFDESTIFGDQSGSPMPIVDEVKNISSTVKDDLRMLSRLNPNDDRYDEIRKRVEKNQDVIVKFDQINKKLLEIRNAGTDESQWSAGMDETTADMWRDIYTSNGKNIKIQDGKLVWTDTKGTTSYDFEFNYDFFYDANENPIQDQNIRRRTPDGRALYSLGNSSEEKIQNADKSYVETLQEQLNILNITDSDGNALEVDGEWGPKSQSAYDKYLKNKDNLEKAWLDENLTDEEKKEFQVGPTTGVGETRTIDLSAIGDGPTMIDNEATNLDRVIKGEVQKFIEMDGTIDDPMYNQMIKAKLFELNKLSPQGIKSLIFDGMNTDDDDLFTGSNTNSFLEGIVRNHYSEDLSAEEIAEKIDLMRSGDVTQQYKDENGELKTLRSQYMKWYKGEIDGMIEGGKKSKVVSSATGNTNTRSSSSSSSSSKNNLSKTGDYTKTGVNFTYGTRGTSTASYGNKTIGGYELKAGEIGVTGKDLKLIVSNNNRLKNIISADDSKNYIINNDNILMKYDEDTESWTESDFNPNSTDPDHVNTYNHIMKSIQTQIKKEGGTFEYLPATTFEKYESRIDHLGGTDELNREIERLSEIGGFPNIRGNDKALLSDGSASDIVDAFNKKWEKYGFYAKDVEGEEDIRITDKLSIGKRYEKTGEGVIRIYYRSPANGKVYDATRETPYIYGSETWSHEDGGSTLNNYDTGGGSYIDVIHDSWSTDQKRRWKNESYLQDFIRHFMAQNDSYYNEKVKYTSSGTEVGDNVETIVIK